MIRLLTPAPPVWSRSMMRFEAQQAWPNLVDLNEVNNGVSNVAVYFESNPPTQTAFAALVAAHDPTPPPPTAEEVAFAAAIAQLRATFNTSRTLAQTNNSLDALTVLMRRVFRELQ